MKIYPTHYGNNPLFPNMDDFEVVMKNDQSGLGVISYRSFSKGELIAHITGEFIRDIRQHSLQIDAEKHLYDTYFSGYFLHSCEPNISLDMKSLTVHAVKDIEAYEFLYMDYSETEEKLFKQFACNCCSPLCRGWITGHNESIDFASTEYQNFRMLSKIAI